jgi:hypothetical protein
MSKLSYIFLIEDKLLKELKRKIRNHKKHLNSHDDIFTIVIDTNISDNISLSIKTKSSNTN